MNDSKKRKEKRDSFGFTLIQGEDDIIKGSDDEESANDTDDEDTICEYDD